VVGRSGDVRVPLAGLFALDALDELIDPRDMAEHWRPVQEPWTK
jgi:hypothetical protein